MNKAKLLEAITEITGSKKNVASRNLEATLFVISKALKEGERVTLVGFGSFRVSKRASRNGINPKTKSTIKIAESNVPRFTAGSALRKAVASK